MTECNVTVECTVTMECRTAVGLTGLAGAVADESTEQVGAVVASAAALQTKSLTLAPLKPKREIVWTSMTLQRFVRFVPPA